MSPALISDRPSGAATAAKSWSRALELTAGIADAPRRTFPAVVDELAAKSGDAPALLSDRERFSFSGLAERSNRYARWAIGNGLAKGDTVCLLMSNRPEYMAIWLGITRIGAVVALLNTNLSGASLAHCINVVEPKHIIAEEQLVEALGSALPELAGSPEIWIHGAAKDHFRRIDEEIVQLSGEPLESAALPSVTVRDRALYIYTSGTTGLPKAANISHARIMQWSHWFAGMMNIQPGDRLYDSLPMYHSVGGVLAPGAVLAGGGSLVTREKFSASQFWSDVVRWDCTIVQYIGELCRYLLNTPPSSADTAHRIRMACGNGLARDIWSEYKTRFAIPRIFEFYAATEGGVSLFNIEEERGAIGRVPGYLAHRFSPALVRFDFERGEPIRNDEGRCIRCAPGEPGEAIGPILDEQSNLGSRFEGYTTHEASEKKILRNVFKSGDAWVRTGDLMRRDTRGFFYFVDRVGDTFRWKGENVATTEVAEIISAFPGISHASVYGVAVPGRDGRAGMAALVVNGDLDLTAFRKHLSDRLPHYARPLFLRVGGELEATGTFKYTKSTLLREGFDPSATEDILYFDHPAYRRFVRIEPALFKAIQADQVRL
ncbi:MAG TPA: long-chain-acyl-CoA synthetase [Bryobacteraceae bacterium]|nr:long-chain-acyl-CoA synthetase [Bryobacteraceae bacterium]